VRAQVEPAALGVLQLDVEGVLHRTRRVVFRVVQRREAHPVGLDLGTVGHVEAHAAEDGLDAFDGAAHRVQATGAAAAAGQRDVQRLGAQLLLEFGFGQLLAASLQGGFDAGLGLIDLGAAGLLLIGRQRAQALQQFRDAAALAEVARLGVFQRSGVRGGAEVSLRGVHQGVEVVHGFAKDNKKGRPEVTAFECLRGRR
jgi:hypothetical protein